MSKSCLLTAMMIVAAGMLDVAWGGGLDAAADDHSLNNMCSHETCKVGTTAITYATKTDPYYACPTRELTDYVSTILGFVEMSATINGTLPNISDKTGEPEFSDETQHIAEVLRTKAKVTTFDQAVASCQRGKSGRKVTILNIPDDMLLAVYVYDGKANSTSWMPLTALNKKP